MSTTYELVEGDDIREIKMQLLSTPTPVEATLVMVRSSARVERALEWDEEIERWKYRFEDEDFEELIVAGLPVTVWKGQVYGTYEDGTNGTYPTREPLTIKVYKRL